MAARPLSISASGRRGELSFLTPMKIGMREAAANMMKANRMLGSASPICWKTVSPLEASAPAAMNPSMASLPLMVSGPAPEKAIASPKLTDFLAGAGGGGGGVAGKIPRW